LYIVFFSSSRRRHTRSKRDWSSDVCSSDLIIVILAASGFRSAVFEAIPSSLKAAIGVGICLFIAMIGFVDGGFVTRVPDAAMTAGPVRLGQCGPIAAWPAFIFVIGLIICGGLVVRNVRGGLFIGIISTTIIALIVQAFTGSEDWGMATPAIPDSLGGIPDLSIVGQVDLFGAVANIGIVATTLL